MQAPEYKHTVSYLEDPEAFLDEEEDRKAKVKAWSDQMKEGMTPSEREYIELCPDGLLNRAFKLWPQR